MEFAKGKNDQPKLQPLLLATWPYRSCVTGNQPFYCWTCMYVLSLTSLEHLSQSSFPLIL